MTVQLVSLHSGEGQANLSWPLSIPKQNSFFNTCLSSMLPPASSYSLGRALSLSLPFWVFVKVSCEFCLLWTVGGRPRKHTSQLRVSSQMKGLRTKKVQGSCPALFDCKIGIPPQRGEKLGRTEYIAARQLSTHPPPFSKLLSSFYVIAFR